MNLLQEIHNETKISLQSSTKHHIKKITIISLILGTFFTIGFYYTGVGVFQTFADEPLVVPFLFAGIQSWSAMMMTQFILLYFFCFTKCSSTKIINGYGKFNINSMLHDDLAPIEFAKRTDEHIFKRLLKKFKPTFNALRDDLFNELHTNQKKNNQRFEQLEQVKIQHSENDKTSFNYIKQLEGDLRKSNYILRAKNQNKDKKILEQNKKIQEQDKELKIWKKVASDVSFKANYKQKQLDKFQTNLDDFVEY